MFKIASVIVDNPSKEVDRTFDYIIPSELIGIIGIGMRVIVPFGKGNKTIEGYVIEIKNDTEFDTEKLKKIIDITDCDTFLSEELLQLAFFIKDKYYCTMNDALKTILPTGINLKEKIYLKLGENYKNESGKYANFLNSLSKDKFIEYKNAKQVFPNITRAALFSLAEKGIIQIKKVMHQEVNIKARQVYKIKDEREAQEFIKNASNKLLRQKEILEKIIKDNCELTLSELCNRYGCSSSVIKSLEDKGLIFKVNKEILRKPYATFNEYKKNNLTDDQKNAINNIIKSYESGKNITLLRGVTGCGKTEIYLDLVERFMNQGYGSIVLVPEIALTPQTVERFKGRFGDEVAVFHSRLSEGERFDEWRRIARGNVKVVVGARSAVFMPVKNLKLIIIDEEHEHTYKSEVTPKYFTKEIAEFRMNNNKGLVVLGSATPSLESYTLALRNKYNLVEIDKRVDDKKLPDIRIIDMREELKNGNRSVFSRELLESIKQNLDNHNQTILFLNRRGYSTFISCRACGYVCACESCDVSMTYHANTNKLECHYCGAQKEIPSQCPQCGSKYIKYFGAGTEKIEYQIKKFFPNARILRMDLDTTRKKGEQERIYKEFKENKADILIGTQMISKGMDFKNVTLVGVVAADTSLNLPDFRAAERTFQILMQVAGRAGRGEKSGKVIIQTYEPEHYSIKYVKNHDYCGFYNEEINYRKILNNPPFTEILYVLFTSEKEDELVKKCMEIKEKIKNTGLSIDSIILGPTPCPISKINNLFRWHMLIKGDASKYYKIIKEILNENLFGSSINYSLDINPNSMY
ncbi:hypothetical protein Q428_03085 [Fervidicella metallireducens AeB]|uniref:Replication restart protein PriA n=1 Tax=Fervidicella metallireducens AeB TaxID=1403537 RepID=A0A017RWW1_9CLOT|nr:primosomal protein N' [Fervidicella metallireducens]EYE89273.1 hypothetical protein Q428_03085 [Fervidicella metallireducens AeB]